MACVSTINTARAYTDLIVRNVREFDASGAAFGPTASVAGSLAILTTGELAAETTEFLYGLGVDWQRELHENRVTTRLTAV